MHDVDGVLPARDQVDVASLADAHVAQVAQKIRLEQVQRRADQPDEAAILIVHGCGQDDDGLTAHTVAQRCGNGRLVDHHDLLEVIPIGNVDADHAFAVWRSCGDLAVSRCQEHAVEQAAGGQDGLEETGTLLRRFKLHRVHLLCGALQHAQVGVEPLFEVFGRFPHQRGLLRLDLCHHLAADRLALRPAEQAHRRHADDGRHDRRLRLQGEFHRTGAVAGQQ